MHAGQEGAASKMFGLVGSAAAVTWINHVNPLADLKRKHVPTFHLCEKRKQMDTAISFHSQQCIKTKRE